MGERLRFALRRKLAVRRKKEIFVRQMTIFVSHGSTFSPLAPGARWNGRANSIPHRVTFRESWRFRDTGALRRAGKGTIDPAPEARARLTEVASAAGCPPAVPRDSWPDRAGFPPGCCPDPASLAAVVSRYGISTRDCARLEKPSLEDSNATSLAADA